MEDEAIKGRAARKPVFCVAGSCVASPTTTNREQCVARMRPHIQLSSPGLTGRPSIPETPMIEPKSRGVPDHPVKPGDDSRVWSRTIHVIASEATCPPKPWRRWKQSISPQEERMDCFVASLPCTNASRLSQAMTARCQGRLIVARRRLDKTAIVRRADQDLVDADARRQVSDEGDGTAAIFRLQHRRHLGFARRHRA